MIGVSAFVYKKNPSKPTNFFFLMCAVSASIFALSHVLGTNLVDPEASRFALMFNLSNISTVIFTFCWLLSAVGRLDDFKKSILWLTSIGAVLVLFFMAFPEFFMLASKPAFYFKNYYVIGPLYPLLNVFFFGVIGYGAYQFVHVYKEANPADKNRLKYFLFALAIGYGLGSIDFLPLYGINIDTLLASVFGFYSIPVAHGILVENLMDVNIIAKRAFVYSLGVVSAAIFIISINYVNNFFMGTYPGFPSLVIPLLSALLAVGFGVFFWKKYRETEVLKYEFINVVTHKFRTPLTYVNWSLDEIEKNPPEELKTKSLSTIREASRRLTELTNMLVGTLETDKGQYTYKFETKDIVQALNEIITSAREVSSKKSINLTVSLPQAPRLIEMDVNRIKFVFQMIVENALIYTPAGKAVFVDFVDDRKSITFLVRDMGIGIKKEDLSLIFSEFYRTKEATSRDTEGMGLGLYISKDIVRRHNGKIWVESEGEGKGSTFYVKLPLKS